MTYDDRRELSPRRPGDDRNVFHQGLVGIGWVALISLGITLMSVVLAVVVSIGY